MECVGCAQQATRDLLCRQPVLQRLDGKVAARNVRRGAQDSLRTLEKDGEESQDIVRRALTTLQDHTDAAVDEMDAASKKKEEEVMEV